MYLTLPYTPPRRYVSRVIRQPISFSMRHMPKTALECGSVERNNNNNNNNNGSLNFKGHNTLLIGFRSCQPFDVNLPSLQGSKGRIRSTYLSEERRSDDGWQTRGQRSNVQSWGEDLGSGGIPMLINIRPGENVQLWRLLPGTRHPEELCTYTGPVYCWTVLADVPPSNRHITMS